MSKHKTLVTQYEDDYGIIEIDKGSVFLGTSSTPQLFGIDSDEKTLAEYFSKFIMEDEDRYFDWDKDIPNDWKLVEIEVRVIKNTEVDPSKIISSEIWEELGESESAIVKSIIENEEVEPFERHSSLHVWEDRYKIDDDTIRLIGAIGGKDSSVERLKK